MNRSDLLYMLMGGLLVGTFVTRFPKNGPVVAAVLIVAGLVAVALMPSP